MSSKIMASILGSRPTVTHTKFILLNNFFRIPYSISFLSFVFKDC
jgi:hypothetical protein